MMTSAAANSTSATIVNAAAYSPRVWPEILRCSSSTSHATQGTRAVFRNRHASTLLPAYAVATLVALMTNLLRHQFFPTTLLVPGPGKLFRACVEFVHAPTPRKWPVTKTGKFVPHGKVSEHVCSGAAPVKHAKRGVLVAQRKGAAMNESELARLCHELRLDLNESRMRANALADEMGELAHQNAVLVEENTQLLAENARLRRGAR